MRREPDKSSPNRFRWPFNSEICYASLKSKYDLPF